MGLDYSINLYFPVGRVGAALRAYSQIASANHETVVRVLDETVSVPFSSNWQHDPVDLVAFGDRVALETTALFPIDDAIEQGDYAHGIETVEGKELAHIGYIYLKVRLGCLYAEFSFTAATSGMSRLFVASDAIRGQFRTLLAAAGGVVGWLDMEDFEFHSLDDPDQTIFPEGIVSYLDESDESAGRSTPDWTAMALCQGLGRPLPAFERLLAARTSTAVGLARAINAAKSFDLLPILADALQDAGCDDADVLDHCRCQRSHTGRCFVPDLLQSHG